MCCLSNPFADQNPLLSAKKIVEATYDQSSLNQHSTDLRDMIGRLLQPKAEQRPDIVSVLASFPQQRMVCMKLEDLYIENYNCKRREGEHNRKFEELHLKLAQKEQELRRACAAPSRAPTALAHPDAFPAPATPTALERIKVAALPSTARHAHCTMQVRNVKEVDPTSSMLNQVLPSLSSPLSSLLFMALFQVYKMVAISQLQPDIRLQPRAASDRTVRKMLRSRITG